jgi:hypothetical protein
MVPRRHKLGFAGTAGVMAITSACSTAVPFLVGSLLDRVKTGTEEGLSALPGGGDVPGANRDAIL